MGNMSYWENIVMANNHLQGPIPTEFCQLNLNLKLLDLSSNNISGSLPSCFSPSTITEVHLSKNKLQGPLIDAFVSSAMLVTLDLSHNHFTGNIPNWIANLSQLSHLILNNNHLEGSIPLQICMLGKLSLINLANNNLSGKIPPCLKIMTGNNISRYNISSLTSFSPGPSLTSFSPGPSPNSFSPDPSPTSFSPGPSPTSFSADPSPTSFSPGPTISSPSPTSFSADPSPTSFSPGPPISSPGPTISSPGPNGAFSIEVAIEFIRKNRSDSYKGRVLAYLSGIDLSCNKLTGEIPQEVRNFQNINVLNLSHNSLTGPIPPKVSELMQIESLDLSNNSLSGEIPSQIVGLTFLSFFSVAYNNLSGSTPKMTAQFATFEENSYLGNPFLCGPPLPKSCSTSGPASSSSKPKASSENGLIDMNVFYVSFGVAYIMVILTIASVLYINPYWRRAWFYHIEEGITCCYYFLEDNILPKRFHCGCI